jgi:hypothetical protein
MEEQDLKKEVEEMQKKISTTLEMDKLSEMLVDNKIEFEANGVSYRTTKPTFKQKQEANEKRVTKFGELMKDDKYVMEDTLIEMYKKKNVDIKEMDNKLLSLDKQRQAYLFKLGQAIKENKDNAELETYKDEIQKITNQQQEITMKRAILMDASLESQLNVFVYTYIAYLVTEKKENDVWVKVWNTYDDFLNCEETLINLAVFYASFLTRIEL